MAGDKVRLTHTGPQIDAGIDAALNPDTVPEADSDALITSDAVAKVQAGLAPFENGATSSAPYSIGDLLVRQGILYKAKTAIAVGDAFTVDSNIEVATIAEVLANFDPGPAPYTSNPAMDGTASPGSSGQYADGAHVHPHDTSIQQISAPTLTSPASENVAAGVYRVYNNLLYQVSAAISSGETASSFESKLTAVPEGGLNALKSAFLIQEFSRNNMTQAAKTWDDWTIIQPYTVPTGYEIVSISVTSLTNGYVACAPVLFNDLIRLMIYNNNGSSVTFNATVRVLLRKT